MRFIVSTVGTSILTNSINREKPDEAKNWASILRDSANLKAEELTDKTKITLDTLADRALEKLLKNDINTNRRISAELNGIYGIYDGSLPKNSNDQHYLICSDTAQGQTTGQLIAAFLQDQGTIVSVETPTGLSTKDTKSFTDGIKALIKWLEEYVPKPPSEYEVIFNLVGGFKSLQGYMNTFGAFYANEVVYIFEGSPDLIRIPRLPIQIDTSVIEDNVIEFAMMAAGQKFPIDFLSGIPETLLEKADDHAGISAWGLLIWHRTKSDLLGKELLNFQRLDYKNTFIDDCKSLNKQQQTDLQETLADVTVALKKTNGDTTQLNDHVSGLNFEQLTGFNGIYTMRIDRNFRVSCEVANGYLKFRHYGTHDYVYNNP